MNGAFDQRGFIAGLLLIVVAIALAYGIYDYKQTGQIRFFGVVFNQNGISGSSTTPTLQNEKPQIFFLDPVSSSIGEIVTISGTGFTLTENTVTFGSYTLGVFDSISAGNGQKINIKVPTSLNSCQSKLCNNFVYNLEPGQFPISVKNKNGTSNTVILQIGGGVAPDSVKTYP